LRVIVTLPIKSISKPCNAASDLCAPTTTTRRDPDGSGSVGLALSSGAAKKVPAK
jgi:hypothetical protein